MSSAALSINSLMESFARPDVTTAITQAIIDRQHFTGPNLKRTHDYESHHHSYKHKHKGGKRSIALSALTLLSFLFFLHILQTCLQEHMDSMNSTASPQIIIMQARLKAQRRADALKRKTDASQQPISLLPFYENITETEEKEPRTKVGPSRRFNQHQNTMSQIPIKLKIVERRSNRPGFS